MPTSKSFARNSSDQQRLALVVLGGSTDAPVHVRAHYNPHEVSFERAATWRETPQKGVEPDLHFTNSNARTMTLELMFDCAEIAGQTLEDDLETLESLMLVKDPQGKDADRKPPILEVINGPLPQFRCVLESLAVKVTMFDRGMHPIRATATIKLKEVKGAAKLDGQNPTSIPRENFLEWTKAETDAKAGDAYREQDWRARREAQQRYDEVKRDVGELE